MIKILICCASGSRDQSVNGNYGPESLQKRRGGSERQALSDCGRKVLSQKL